MEKTKVEVLKERLSLYIKAEKSILDGAQEYRIGSRNLRRGDLAEIRKAIDKLTDEIAVEEAIEKGKKRRKTVAVLFRDW